MMLRKSAYLGAFAGLLLACLAFAPAQWLASSLASATDGKVLLDAPRGTVWSGSAQLVLAGGAGSAGAMALPSRLSWQLSLAWLGLDLAMQAPCCTDPVQYPQGLQTRIRLQGTSDLRLDLSGKLHNLPAQLLSGLGSPWNTLQLVGDLSFETQTLTSQWSTQGALKSLKGTATIQARQMQTALSTVRPLGSYTLQLLNSQIQLQTASPDDALQLSGTGELLTDSKGQPRFSGEAVAAVGREASLSNLLHIIGQRQTSTDGRMRTVLNL